MGLSPQVIGPSDDCEEGIVTPSGGLEPLVEPTQLLGFIDEVGPNDVTVASTYGLGDDREEGIINPINPSGALEPFV